MAPPAPGNTPSGFAPASPEELFIAYRRIDTLLQKQLAEGGQPPANLAQINKDFDEATLKLFTGQMRNVLKDFADIASDITTPASPEGANEWLALRSLAVRFELQGDEPAVIFESLFALSKPVHTKLLVNFGSGPSADFKSYPFHLEPGSAFELRVPLKPFINPHADRSLSVQYSLAAAAQADHWESRPFILPSPEHQLMIDDLESQLSKVPEIESTSLMRSIVRARLNLLKEPRNSDNSFHYFGFSNRVLAEIQGNFKLLRYGKSPFKDRDGLVYRPIITQGSAIPSYIYAPPSAFGHGPVPLVILLHGAGGDESLFMSAYGNGEAKRQAQEHGCIIASPSTTAVISNPSAIEALIDQAAADYPIDRSRVFVVGHSMGAAAASVYARARANVLAGVVCLAGGAISTKPLADGERIVPILSINAALDPIMKKFDPERHAEAVKASGLPIELRDMKDWGHTLMVGPALPQAFEWMMACKPNPQPEKK